MLEGECVRRGCLRKRVLECRMLEGEVVRGEGFSTEKVLDGNVRKL